MRKLAHCMHLYFMSLLCDDIVMRTHKTTSRHFIRHPSGIPIEIQISRATSELAKKPGIFLEAKDLEAKEKLNDISYGGLSFSSEKPMETGDTLTVKISISHPAFKAQGTVSWCKPRGNQYLIGIKFLDQGDAFMARMVEQICHIEHYRHETHEKEGRDLSSEEAALEWISKYARDFPDPDNG